MKSVIKSAMFAAAGVLALSMAAQAETIEVKVPFAFLVGSEKMPAGVYRIERGESLPSSVVLIQGKHGNRAQLLVQTTPIVGASPATDKPVLVFVPDETPQRLVQVWEGANSGQEVASGR